jgi:hypothetical protein
MTCLSHLYRITHNSLSIHLIRFTPEQRAPNVH